MSTRFDLTGKTALITGGGGVLGGAMADALAAHGARIIVCGRREEPLRKAVARIEAAGGSAGFVTADTTDVASFDAALAQAGDVHILLNAAGGTDPKAITSPERSLFELDMAAMRAVMDQNWMGTVVPCIAVAKQYTQRGEGVIINIASMSSYKPVTRNVAYSSGKSAAMNFTEWLAVHLAQQYSPRIRVNAIAPGFFLAEQNRALLTDPATGELNARAQTMIRGTPMGRLGQPADLGGTVVFLASDASAFLTGVTIPVDGGFQAFGGV
jgi:NAD(P)-dependent dehydrogenase (short-subunit alcohol dehydrogenase family)